MTTLVLPSTIEPLLPIKNYSLASGKRKEPALKVFHIGKADTLTNYSKLR
jgi:hypothetical protein